MKIKISESDTSFDLNILLWEDTLKWVQTYKPIKLELWDNNWIVEEPTLKLPIEVAEQLYKQLKVKFDNKEEAKYLEWKLIATEFHLHDMRKLLKIK